MIVRTFSAQESLYTLIKDPSQTKKGQNWNPITEQWIRWKTEWGPNPAVPTHRGVGTSYTIITMYLNIPIMYYVPKHTYYYYATPYTRIHSHTPLYTPYTPLYITTHPYTSPYTPLNHHILLYITIYPYTTLYAPIHNHTYKGCMVMYRSIWCCIGI